MKYTEHYRLEKPDGTDTVDIGVLNSNMDAIDTMLYDIYSRLPTPPQCLRL